MLQDHPINEVKWVNVDQIQANDYNPNKVASTELKLLYVSIKQDGYTQPIVTFFDKEINKYVIVDGFHRYFVGKSNKDILDSTEGKLPIVVIDKEINDRMASTVRHNRARGSHSIKGMSHMVFEMLDKGWDDVMICNHLGMEADEIVRLKHITGFSKLFKNTEYSKSWQTKNQLLLQKEYKDDINDSK